MDIKEALEQLDPLNDDHWTSNGDPRLEAVSSLLGVKVTRQNVTDAAPKFTRENPELSAEDESEETEPEEVVLIEPDTDLLQKYLDADSMNEVQFRKFMQNFPSVQLAALLELIEKQFIEIEQQEASLKELRRSAKFAKAFTTSRIKSEVPDMSETEARQNYIRKQTELRRQKHLATSDLLKGVDLKKLDPRAPIDRAMARKNTRGAQRPNHPVRNG
jgi:hypothetical protein